MPQTELWFVYILECAGKRLYVGIAQEVEARFAQHCAGSRVEFAYGDPEAPAGEWFKRFENFIVCGEGELVKTFLKANQTAVGEEVE